MLVFILQSVVFILWLLVIASSPSSPCPTLVRSRDSNTIQKVIYNIIWNRADNNWQLLSDSAAQLHFKEIYAIKISRHSRIIPGTFKQTTPAVRCTCHIMKTRLFKYIENFTIKNWTFQIKKLWYFSNFCSKHRLWVHVRTAPMRRF